MGEELAFTKALEAYPARLSNHVVLNWEVTHLFVFGLALGSESRSGTA